MTPYLPTPTGLSVLMCFWRPLSSNKQLMRVQIFIRNGSSRPPVSLQVLGQSQFVYNEVEAGGLFGCLPPLQTLAQAAHCGQHLAVGPTGEHTERLLALLEEFDPVWGAATVEVYEEYDELLDYIQGNGTPLSLFSFPPCCAFS